MCVHEFFWTLNTFSSQGVRVDEVGNGCRKQSWEEKGDWRGAQSWHLIRTVPKLYTTLEFLAWSEQHLKWNTFSLGRIGSKGFKKAGMDSNPPFGKYLRKRRFQNLVNRALQSSSTVPAHLYGIRSIKIEWNGYWKYRPGSKTRSLEPDSTGAPPDSSRAAPGSTAPELLQAPLSFLQALGLLSWLMTMHQTPSLCCKQKTVECVIFVTRHHWKHFLFRWWESSGLVWLCVKEGGVLGER